MVGSILYPYSNLSIFWCAILIVTLYGIANVFHALTNKNKKWSPPFGIVVLLFFLILGIGNRSLKDPLNNKLHYTHHNYNIHHTYLFSIHEQLKPSQYQDKYIIQLHKQDSTKITGKVLLSIQKDSTQKPLKIGSWYYTRTPLKDLPSIKNPYQFDYGAYLKKKHIYGQFFIQKDELLEVNYTSKNFYTFAIRFRESVIRKLRNQPFTQEQLTVIQALLLGKRQDIDAHLSNQYANAGMMHILAVSGLHVGIILLLLRFVTRVISGRKLRWVRSGISISLLWCFAFITGLSPSVLRAVTMFSFLELGSCLGGKRRINDALVFSAFILLIIDPSLIYQVGFQLSYLAVIAILWIQPWLYNFYQPRYYIIKKIWGIITVSVAAQVGVLPLSILYFHQFPGLFLVSNSVVLPFLGIILSLGILVIGLSYFSLLPDNLAIAYGKIIDLLNGFIAWVASKEAFVIDHISLSFTYMILMYLLLASLIYVLKRYQYKRLLLFFSILSFSLVMHIYQKTEKETSHMTIFHKNKETLIGLYSSDSLVVYTNIIHKNFNTDNRIVDYQNALGLDTFHIEPIQDYYHFNQKKLLLIDSIGVYKIKKLHPDYILLRQSPDIHLERLINVYPHVTIIADGSNYRSDIIRWKATCHKRNIPFHSTYEKGYFILKE
ncbi:competence protein ComEC [Dokdonia pacifica]|nr:competence protein ComEC [Dokdonia pacifica]